MSDLKTEFMEIPGLPSASVVTLTGSIDARTVIAFKSQMESAKERGIRGFVLDMERVTYVNSTGLSYLISLADSGDPARPGLALAKVQAKVQVVIDMMGLGTLFKFCSTVEEGIQVIKGSAPPATPPAPPRAPTPAPLPSPEKPPDLPATPPPVRRVSTPLPSPVPPPAAPAARAPTPSPFPAMASRPASLPSAPPTVRLVAEPSRSPQARNEDWLALILGMLFAGAILAGVKPPLASLEWATDGEFFAAAAANKPRIDRLEEEAAAPEIGELAGAAGALRRAYETGHRGSAAESSRALAEAAAKTPHADLRAEALRLDREVGRRAEATLERLFSARNLLHAGLLGFCFLIVAAIGVAFMGGRLESFALGFPVVFALAWLAQLLAGNAALQRGGLEQPIFALVIGLLLGNALGVPAWLRESLRGEFYLKTGFVILGASVILPDLLRAGFPGLAQGVLIVVVAGVSGFWISRLLRVDEDFAAMISSGISVGGIPAAIGSFVSVRGDRKKLGYLVSLMLLLGLPLMFVMPALAREFSLSAALSGSWLGGTLDTPAAVSAAGPLLNESVRETALSAWTAQTMMIFPVVLLLSSLWALRHAFRQKGHRGFADAWSFFPKPVLGFLALSLLFSYGLPAPRVAESQPLLSGLRDTWLVLAFVSIGIETRFSDLVRLERGRPAAAVILVQLVNVLIALLAAYLLFGGVLLPSSAS